MFGRSSTAKWENQLFQTFKVASGLTNRVVTELVCTMIIRGKVPLEWQHRVTV